MEPVFTDLPLDSRHDGLHEAVRAGAMSDLRWYEVRCDTRAYTVGHSRDDITFGRELPPDWRWHISVAGQESVPRWSDLVAIAHRLRPGVMFAVGIPPRNMWMSVHPHTLHVYEIKDENLEEQWRFEGRFARSTPS